MSFSFSSSWRSLTFRALRVPAVGVVCCFPFEADEDAEAEERVFLLAVLPLLPWLPPLVLLFLDMID